MTSSMNTGVLGSKVISWRNSNPRDLLKRIVESNPDAKGVELVDLIKEAMAGSINRDDYLDSIIEYWAVNTRRRLFGAVARSPSAGEVRAKADQIKSTIAARMLDLLLPNGKPLRDCTAHDCLKAGGWFKQIAAKLKPMEKVGDVLSEQQVRKMYGGEK